jgi:hypothetical protein
LGKLRTTAGLLIEYPPRTCANDSINRDAVRRLKLPHSFIERIVKQIFVHRRGGHIKPFPEQGDLILFDAFF